MKIKVLHSRDNGVAVLVSHKDNKWGSHFYWLVDSIVASDTFVRPCKLADRNWQILLKHKEYAGRIF